MEYNKSIIDRINSIFRKRNIPIIYDVNTLESLIEIKTFRSLTYYIYLIKSIGDSLL